MAAVIFLTQGTLRSSWSSPASLPIAVLLSWVWCLGAPAAAGEQEADVNHHFIPSGDHPTIRQFWVAHLFLLTP